MLTIKIATYIFVFILTFILPLLALFHCGFHLLSSYSSNKNKKKKEIDYTSDENLNWNCHLKTNHPESCPCFTFEQIKTFYYTAPEKWKMRVYSICYHKSERGWAIIHTPTKEDYILTLRFLKEQEENKQKQKQIETTLALLPYLEKDAKRAQEEANNMLIKCEQEFQIIAKNLEREKRLSYENSILM